jgi:hypothetical protein
MYDPNPHFSKAHLATLNLNNVKDIKANGIKNYCIEVSLNVIALCKI